MGSEWIAPTSNAPPLYDKPLIFDIPPVYDHSKNKSKKVRTLQSFLRSCLELMKDEPTLSSLHGMTHYSSHEKEKPIAHIMVNQVHSKREQTGSSGSMHR
jgi:hypothetical protein